jgi:hypothetical protein
MVRLQAASAEHEPWRTTKYQGFATALLDTGIGCGWSTGADIAAAGDCVCLFRVVCETDDPADGAS